MADCQGDRAKARPLSTAWITDELLAETQQVWSAAYGRPIGTTEAMEILMNVRRLAEAFVEGQREEGATE